MIVLTLLAGGVGLWQVLTIGQAIGDAREKEQQRARSLELLAAGYRLVASLDRTLVTQDPALMSTDVPVSLGTLIFYMETLQQAGGEPKTADLLEEMQEAYAQLRQAVNDVDVLARQEHWAEVEAALEQEIRPVNRQMNLLIRRLVRQADRDAQAVALRAQASVWQAAILLGLLTALTTVIALGWRQFVFRDLSLSITKLRQGVTRISSGDLEHQIDVRTGDEIEELGNEFNKMADQLAGVIGTLEQHVSERTRGLQAAADVARATTMVLDPDQLLRQVVDLARERFDLYYVGLFLLDDERRFALLRAGTGQAGQTMVEQRHRLEVGGESMIGQCVARSEARTALDVGEEPSRFDNPLLPQTRSEMALPLRSRGRVIGAMTVQSAEEAAFDEADIAVMQTMADQVAVAIDNARLFAETHAVLERMEATHRRYLGQAWAEYALTRAISGYAQTDAGTVPLGDQVLPEVLRAMTEQRPVIWSDDGDEGRAERLSPTTAIPDFETPPGPVEQLSSAAKSSTLAAPIRLRGQPIGVLGFKEEGERQWSEDDVALVEALAEQFALAADNLRLLDETQRRAARERLTSEITDKMRRATDMDALMQTAIQEMGAVLGASSTFVQLAVSSEPAGDGKENGTQPPTERAGR